MAKKIGANAMREKDTPRAFVALFQDYDKQMLSKIPNLQYN